MSLPVVLDIAIGLIGLFFALSLLASALLEFYAAAFNRPGKILEWGIGHLFADPSRLGLARDFYEHPLIRGMSGRRKPSRIEPNTAARVLVDLLDKAGVLDGAPANPVLEPFLKMVPAGTTNIRQDLLQPIADWYKEGVERLSGVAARRSQILLFIIGLVIAASGNINTIKITEALSTQDALRKIGVEAATSYFEKYPQLPVEPPKDGAAAAAAAEPGADAAAQDLKKKKEASDKFKKEFLDAYAGFPMGWEGTNFCAAWKNWGWLGWLLTAMAISMGAQFWYRLLGELLKLRGGKSEPAGTKPAQ